MRGCDDEPLFVSLNNAAASLTNSEDGCDRILMVHSRSKEHSALISLAPQRLIDVRGPRTGHRIATKGSLRMPLLHSPAEGLKPV
jgi:hypothetical protein